MRPYLRTVDIARAVGVHPNTVRLYEMWGFLPPIPRSASGCRLFTEEHLDLMRLARTALHSPYPGGKQPALALIERAVSGDLGGAMEYAHTYVAQGKLERARAELAVGVVERWSQGASTPSDEGAPLRIAGVARLLGTTTDSLRNWERNGLLKVPRHPRNGYRLYGTREIDRLRIIRLLRVAGYGMMAILRMMRRFDRGQTGGLRQALDTPHPDEDILYATDRWLSTLAEQERRAMDAIAQLEAMINRRRHQSEP